MPRGSASGKRQQGPAAASHAKHDNGLVTPGRKVLRSKNNPHPDTARSKPPSQTATTASPPRPQQKSIAPPSSPLNGNLNGRAARLPAANGRHSNGSAVTNGFPKLPDYDDDDDNMAIGHRSHPARRSSLGADSETSASADSFHSQHQNHHHGRNVNSSHHNGNGHHDHHLFSDSALATHEPREIDVNASKYAGDVHRDPGPLDYATTVLMSLPLHDTLAILLILMHVSPLTLSVIYTVFTVLTFASPLTAHSVVNVHLAELLDWHSTMPSLVTVLCVDVLALMVFLFLWPSVQNAILDLAKPVIAATLGGGSSSRGGQSRTVSACFSIMIGTHVFKNTRGYWSRFIQLLPPSWRISPDTDDPLEDASSIGAAASLIRNPQPYFTILGLHILMQGVVRYIREWYIRRERISAASASHAGDPEAGKPTPTSTDPADPVHALDGGEPPIASATTAHGTSTSSNKRRRKQSAQVRLQQPLWAALASTKVVMVKEYELSHATSEAASPGATDIHNLGNAPFDREGGKIWISYVGCDEVSFDTSPFPDDFSDDGEAEAPPSPGCDSGRGMSTTTTIDRSRPFYVKINNAHWLSTRVEPAGDEVSGETPADVESSRSEAHGGPQGTRWTGDIYGLRPMSKYVCQFVDSRTDEVLFMTNITTTREQTKNSAAAAAAAAAITNGMPNGQRRSHSPTTTLKTSIAASDAKLAAERTKLKTLRREWKVKVNALRKENEGTDHAINSAGGTDDRFRQKIRQQETQKAQSEKEAQELADELRAFESAWPGDAAERRKRTEERWAAEKRAYENGQKELKRHSATVGSAVKAREADRQQLQTRRNKTASRVGKVDSELANIADANERGLNEAERRRLEREAWQARVSTAEEKMKADFGALQADNAALQDQHEAAMKQAKALHTQLAYAAATAVGFEQGGVAAALAGMPSPAQYPTVSWAATNPPAPAPAMPPSLYGPNHQWTAEAGLTAGSGGAPQWRFPMQLAAQHALAGQQQQSQQHHSQLPPPPGFRSRGRSSSMLSDVSGFTQLSGEEQAATFMMRGAAPGRPGRGSLGGSSGSGSGSSARDPASPA